jgi:hypothetical protein
MLDIGPRPDDEVESRGRCRSRERGPKTPLHAVAGDGGDPAARHDKTQPGVVARALGGTCVHGYEPAARAPAFTEDAAKLLAAGQRTPFGQAAGELKPRGAYGPWRAGAEGSPGPRESACAPETHAYASYVGYSVGTFVWSQDHRAPEKGPLDSRAVDREMAEDRARCRGSIDDPRFCTSTTSLRCAKR